MRLSCDLTKFSHCLIFHLCHSNSWLYFHHRYFLSDKILRRRLVFSWRNSHLEHYLQLIKTPSYYSHPLTFRPTINYCPSLNLNCFVLINYPRNLGHLLLLLTCLIILHCPFHFLQLSQILNSLLHPLQAIFPLGHILAHRVPPKFWFSHLSNSPLYPILAPPRFPRLCSSL